ncbi:MAG: hypothetical protein NVSMB25_00210 [Thermoleophilaceae bacterium]
MIASTLRLASLVASAVLLASFALFAVDETRNGSQHQVARVAAADAPATPAVAPAPDVNRPSPSPALRAERARRHGSLRETIDRGNDILTGPFTGVVRSQDIWVERGVPALLALLLFGVALRFLANYLR